MVKESCEKREVGQSVKATQRSRLCLARGGSRTESREQTAERGKKSEHGGLRRTGQQAMGAEGSLLGADCGWDRDPCEEKGWTGWTES